MSCVSGAQLSNYATFLVHPEQAPLSIVLTALSTLFGAVVTPALVLLLLGRCALYWHGSCILGSCCLLLTVHKHMSDISVGSQVVLIMGRRVPVNAPQMALSITQVVIAPVALGELVQTPACLSQGLELNENLLLLLCSDC